MGIMDRKRIMETNLKNNIFWKIIDAYPDHKQCLQAMKRVWQAKKNQAIQDKKSTTQFQR